MAIKSKGMTTSSVPKKKKSNPKILSVDIDGKPIYNLANWKKQNPRALFFDSNFERLTYLLFLEAGYNFIFHPESRELLPTFNVISYLSRKKEIGFAKVQSMTYQPDFLLKTNDGTHVYLETKGFFRPEARLRVKLFQASLKQNERFFMLPWGKAKNNPMEHVIRFMELVDRELGGSNNGSLVKKDKPKIKL